MSLVEDQSATGATESSTIDGPGGADVYSDHLLAIDRAVALRGFASQLLYETALDDAWWNHVLSLLEGIRDLVEGNADAALYYLINEKIHSERHYSATHALCCAVVCILIGKNLEWSDQEIDRIGLAALTMNIAMASLQDFLALRDAAAAQKYAPAIAGHSTKSAEVLAAFGCDDSSIQRIVTLHHQAHGDGALGEQPFECVAAEVLRRVDVYAAKMSRRKHRGALTSVHAAKGMLLAGKHNPDTISASLIKAVGLYPPGSYVEMASGEMGVVMRRGKMAHMPTVLSMRKRDGSMQKPFLVRSPGTDGQAIKRAVDFERIRMEISHYATWQAFAEFQKVQGRIAARA